MCVAVCVAQKPHTKFRRPFIMSKAKPCCLRDHVADVDPDIRELATHAHRADPCAHTLKNTHTHTHIDRFHYKKTHSFNEWKSGKSAAGFLVSTFW